MDEAPEAGGRERQFLGLGVESGQRCRHGIPCGGCDRNHAAFTGTFCSERVTWRAVQFHCHAANIWKIARRGKQIVCKRCIQKLGIGVIDNVIKKNTTEALNHSPESLSVHKRRIDRTANVFDRDVVQDFDVADTGVDGDMGCMGAITVSALSVRKSAVHRQWPGGIGNLRK